MVLVQDLLHPNPITENEKNKLKIVQEPNSFSSILNVQVVSI